MSKNAGSLITSCSRPAGRSTPITWVTDGEFTRLDRAESLRLLTGVPVGRLIFTVNALPTVRPMNFALVHGLIVLRTAADTTVARKVDSTIVAFEVADPEAITRYRAVPVVAWAPGVRDQFVTITTELVEGRRVRRSLAQHDQATPPPT